MKQNNLKEIIAINPKNTYHSIQVMHRTPADAWVREEHDGVQCIDEDRTRYAPYTSGCMDEDRTRYAPYTSAPYTSGCMAEDKTRYAPYTSGCDG